MCSIGDDNIEGVSKYMEPKETYKFEGSKCNKCKTEKPSVVLRSKYAYCKACFLAATTHKFKSYLGAVRLSYTDDNILILHKGGHQSTAMLHLLRCGLNLAKYKKLKVNPIVLHIESLHHLSVPERREVLRKVATDVRTFNFDLYFVSLHDYILTNAVNMIQDIDDVPLNESDKNSIKHVLKQNAIETVCNEIITVFEKKIITSLAKDLNCKWAFTTNVAFQIASQILTDMSLGKGANEAFNRRITIAGDSTSSDVKIMTPFMDVDIKELALYNYFNQLQPVTYQMPKQNPYASIQNLMKKFVENLQVSFPSTITTIVKTGEKLTIDKSGNNSEKCSLCQAPKERQTDDLNSAESTYFSHWVSTQPQSTDISSTERYQQMLDSFLIKENTHSYCFSCNNIVKYMIK